MPRRREAFGGVGVVSAVDHVAAWPQGRTLTSCVSDSGARRASSRSGSSSLIEIREPLCRSRRGIRQRPATPTPPCRSRRGIRQRPAIPPAHRESRSFSPSRATHFVASVVPKLAFEGMSSHLGNEACGGFLSDAVGRSVRLKFRSSVPAEIQNHPRTKGMRKNAARRCLLRRRPASVRRLTFVESQRGSSAFYGRHACSLALKRWDHGKVA